MTKKQVIIEAANEVDKLTKRGSHLNVCILHGNKIVAIVGRQVQSEHDARNSVRDRAKLVLAILLSGSKHKKGYDWDLT